MKPSHSGRKAVLVVGLLIFGSTGCERPGRDASAALVIALENDVQTLDPASLSDPYTSRVVWQMYEGLVGFEDGRPVPLLAASWQNSPDMRSWTFRIRPNVYFHRSGLFNTPDSTRSVTAADVVYSYTRFARGIGSFVFSDLVEGLPAYVSGSAETVSGLVAVDSLTFQVRLTRPDPSFIYRITSPYLGVMAREVVEGDSNAFGRTMSAGTGPFVLASRTDAEVRLRRNDRYWRTTKGNVGDLVFRVEKNPQLRITQFRNGQYDLLQLPVSFAPSFPSGSATGAAYQVYRSTTLNVHFLGINNRLVQDVHLRRAIAHAVNRDQIVRNLLHGLAKPASSPTLPGLQEYAPPSAPSFAPDSARAALALSKYDGRPLSILVSDAPSSEQIGLVVRDALGQVGIASEIVKTDFNTATSRVFGADKPELFVYFFEWIFSAPELILGYVGSSVPSGNMFGYKSPQVDSLLGRVPAQQARAEINALTLQAESIMQREVPAVWLFHQTNAYLLNPRLQGFRVNGHNHWELADVRLSR